MLLHAYVLTYMPLNTLMNSLFNEENYTNFEYNISLFHEEELYEGQI
jgi:hypothetical protein